MEELPERSSSRPRHDRQAQSRAQSGVDAIYVDTIAGRPFRRGRRCDGGAGRPNGSKKVDYDVRTACRFESHRQTIRSRGGLHPAISAIQVGETGNHMRGAPEAHHEKAGYGLRREALSPVETLAQSV